MRVVLEGEPSEILSFFHDLNANGGSKVSEFLRTTATIDPSLYEREPRALAPEPEESSEQAQEPSAASALQSDEAQEQQPQTIIPTKIAAEQARQPRIKDRIIEFLEQRRRPSNVGEIAAALGIPSKRLSPRIAELHGDGVLRKTTNKGHHNRYALSGEVKGETPPAPAPQAKQQRLHDLQLLNALVDHPDSRTYEVAQRLGVTNHYVRDRLTDLQSRGLVRRTKHKDNSALWRALPAITKNEINGRESGFGEAIMDVLRRYPGSAGRDIALRLGKTYFVTARRLKELTKSGLVTVTGENENARYSLATTEAEAHPS